MHRTPRTSCLCSEWRSHTLSQDTSSSLGPYSVGVLFLNSCDANRAFWQILSASLKGSCFGHEHVWEFMCTAFPQAKSLQDQMYSFSTNEMTHFFFLNNFANAGLWSLFLGPCVYLWFHLERTLEALNLNPLMFFYRREGGLRGKRFVEFGF